jgi:hypothetical protein
VTVEPSEEATSEWSVDSPLGRFGADGAYMIVVAPDDQTAWVRRTPLAERFVVAVDDDASCGLTMRSSCGRCP